MLGYSQWLQRLTKCPQIFADLGAQLMVIGETPDGLNINLQCWFYTPRSPSRTGQESGAAIGLAFDGDSDRLIAVDENGDIVDGDKIMYIIGKYLSEKGQLAQNTIVTTVMSNLGFHKALDREGINKAVTAVGDRYVVEEMRKSGYNLWRRTVWTRYLDGLQYHR